MFTCKCARCGKVVPITAVQRLVSYDGKRRRWVCSDDRQCWQRCPVKSVPAAR